MEEDKIIAKDSQGKIIKIEIKYIMEGVYGYCNNRNLTEIISIPKNLTGLRVVNNNIKQLPDLRKIDNLRFIFCDMQCFEPYMLEMKNMSFNFVC